MIVHLPGLDVDVRVPHEWQPVPDEDLHRFVHPSGLQLTIRHFDGERGRLDVAVLPAEEVASAPAPRLAFTSAHPLIGWFGGASGEVVAVTPDGPVLARQRRGFTVGSPTEASLFPEPLVVVPGHPLTSVWIVEPSAGDLLDLPAEPSWVPERRHVPWGDEIALRLPDGVVSGVPYQELDDGFLLVGEPGLHVAEVGGPTGISRLEVGWHRDWGELVAEASEDAPDDLWCHLATLGPEVDVDTFDVRLARAIERPTIWSALAAAHGAQLGLCGIDEARRLAQEVLPDADVPTRVALLARGLTEVSSLVGVQLGRVAYDGLLRFGLGRVMSDYPEGAERWLVPGWFWVAGMGETPLAARVGGMLARAHARALCRASESRDPEAVAWLSLFAG